MATESLFNAWHIREKADIEMIAKALEESDRREEEPSFPEAHVLRGKELEEFLKGK